MESKSFRECPKSTLMSLSANVSTGTFTLAKYKCVDFPPNTPSHAAVCQERADWLHLRYSPTLRGLHLTPIKVVDEDAFFSTLPLPCV